MHHIKSEPDMVRRILFSDEAIFCLYGFIYRYNYRYWCYENPHWMKEVHTQYPEKVNFWTGVVGPFLKIFKRKISQKVISIPVCTSYTKQTWLRRKFMVPKNHVDQTKYQISFGFNFSSIKLLFRFSKANSFFQVRRSKC